MDALNLNVVHELHGEKFLHGLEKLFQEYGLVCPDGVRRIRGNGVLKLSYASNLVPERMNGLRVLECVESCMGKAVVSTDRAGLSLDSFVECIGKIAVGTFRDVSAHQAAELIMLQLDQATNCLTSCGPISPSRRGTPRRRPQVAKPTPAQDSQQPPIAHHDTILGRSQAKPVQKQQRLKNAPTPNHANEKHIPSKAHVQNKKRGTKTKGVDTENKFASFLARTQAFEEKRTRKINQLRNKDVRPKRKISLEAQQELTTRLFCSRLQHFSDNSTKYDKLRWLDEKTGQVFFAPKLVAKLSQNERPSPALVLQRKIQQEAKDRFETLYKEALMSQDNHRSRLKAFEEKVSKDANRSKMSVLSRRYVGNELGNDLRELFFNFCPHNRTTGEVKSTDLTQFFLRILGLLKRPKEQQQFVGGVVSYIIDGNVQSIPVASYEKFVKAIVKYDKEKHKLPQKVPLFAQFLRLYYDQKAFEDAEKRGKNASLLEPQRHSPTICDKSRQLVTMKRAREGRPRSSTGDELFSLSKLMEEDRKNRKAQAAQSELEDCTFAPEIHQWERPSHTLGSPTSVRRCSCNSSQVGDLEVASQISECKSSEGLRSPEEQKDFATKQKLLNDRLSKPKETGSKLQRKGRNKSDVNLGDLLSQWSDTSMVTQDLENATSSSGSLHEESKENFSSSKSSYFDKYLRYYKPTVERSSEVDKDELPMLYIDVEFRNDTHRVAIYENESVRKVASRFAALHGINGHMEERLYEYMLDVVSSVANSTTNTL